MVIPTTAETAAENQEREKPPAGEKRVSPPKVVGARGRDFLKAEWQVEFDAGRTRRSSQDCLQQLLPEDKGA